LTETQRQRISLIYIFFFLQVFNYISYVVSYILAN